LATSGEGPQLHAVALFGSSPSMPPPSTIDQDLLHHSAGQSQVPCSGNLDHCGGGRHRSCCEVPGYPSGDFRGNCGVRVGNARGFGWQLVGSYPLWVHNFRNCRLGIRAWGPCVWVATGFVWGVWRRNRVLCQAEVELMDQTGGGQGAPAGLVGHQMPSDRVQIAVVEVFGGGYDRGSGCWVMCQSRSSSIRAAPPQKNSLSTSAPPHHPIWRLPTETHASGHILPSRNVPPETPNHRPSRPTVRRPALPCLFPIGGKPQYTKRRASCKQILRRRPVALK
jgi:hypothetical protein